MVLGKALVPATVFCDFDGTITAVDTFDLLMQDTYGDVWRQLKGDLLCFRLPLRQAMDRLGAMLTARHLRDMEERMATFVPRPGFLHFLDAMDHAGIPVVVVSGGFLPLVEAVLREHRHRFKAIIAGCPVPEDERGARHHIHSPCSSREELVAKALVMDMYSQGRTIAIGDGLRICAWPRRRIWSLPGTFWLTCWRSVGWPFTPGTILMMCRGGWCSWNWSRHRSSGHCRALDVLFMAMELVLQRHHGASQPGILAVFLLHRQHLLG
ncbi:MAG: HAD-IB family phosphatase [Synechococcus sp. SB0662_bin_45]|nr:HAD-IB family phosphatase [Synechococcus sp. SB0668_bin_13]MYE22122.1 HAD-IB family phosphatase [Synechococcus sp. SB0662_bin_45]